MTRSSRTVLISALVIIAASGANGQRRGQIRQALPPKPAISDTDATLEGNRYVNAFYKLSLTVPQEFNIMNRAEVQVYKNAGGDLLRSGRNVNSTTYEAALQNTSVLLLVTTKPPGTPGIAVFEMVSRKQATGVTRDMVLAESLKILGASGKSRVTAALKPTVLGGKTFSGAELETTLNEQVLKVRIYVAMVRGYAIALTFTYTSAESESAFDEMIRTINFKA